MTSKTEVAIEEVFALAAARRKINSLDINDIVWTLKGKPIRISQIVIGQFELTGLNNNDFILAGYHLRE